MKKFIQENGDWIFPVFISVSFIIGLIIIIMAATYPWLSKKHDDKK